MVKAIRKEAEKLIHEQYTLFRPDQFVANYHRFTALDWDEIPDLNAKGQLEESYWWTPSGRLLMFVFANTPGRLELGLQVLSEPAQTKLATDRLLGAVADNPFFSPLKNMRWHRLYNKVFLKEEDYKRLDEYELLDRVRNTWTSFLEEDFSQINLAVQTAFGSNTHTVSS